MKRSLGALGALVLLGGLLLGSSHATGAQAPDYCPAGQAPHYVYGFAALRANIGTAMGDPLTCEYPDPAGTGDVHQETTTGHAFWHKRTNMPTFTDGREHWARTGRGWITWTSSSTEPP